MSIFRPFRSKTAIRTAVMTGALLKLAPVIVEAQQQQQVNVAQINGATPLSAYCDDSTKITSFAYSTNSSGISLPIIQGNVSSSPGFICSYRLTTDNSSVRLRFVRGTSTDCTSNQVFIDGGSPVSSNSGFVESGGGTPLFTLPRDSSQSLCLSHGASTGYVGGRISYVTKD